MTKESSEHFSAAADFWAVQDVKYLIQQVISAKSIPRTP